MMIKVMDLTKKYGLGNTAVEALRGLTFSIPKGQFVVVTGPSGSGKSTLLHLIGALDEPTGGDILVNGKQLATFPQRKLSEYRRRQVGFVFQAYNLVPVLTAEENIMLPVLFDEKKPDKQQIRKLCRGLGIEDRMQHLPGEMSGGQQQRVAVARALVNNPAIILADEPTGNLDREAGLELIKLLCSYAEASGSTLIIVSHNPEIAAMAKRVITIIDGLITSDFLHDN